ncbi:hypothetical protein [Streptomyces umbrinus]|uniref:hypothetical protein n=1 Tax=Streptomyces umbrinus TaxID=67370 RepID=UPI0033FE4CB5
MLPTAVPAPEGAVVVEVGAAVSSADGSVVAEWDGDSDCDPDGDPVGMPDVGADEAEAEAVVEDALRAAGDVSSLPPARAVPVIAATSAPEASRTTDVRFMANLL